MQMFVAVWTDKAIQRIPWKRLNFTCPWYAFRFSVGTSPAGRSTKRSRCWSTSRRWMAGKWSRRYSTSSRGAASRWSIEKDKSHNQYTVLHLFKKPRLARITITLIIYWWVRLCDFQLHSYGFVGSMLVLWLQFFWKWIDWALHYSQWKQSGLFICVSNNLVVALSLRILDRFTAKRVNIDNTFRIRTFSFVFWF